MNHFRRHFASLFAMFVIIASATMSHPVSADVTSHNHQLLIHGEFSKVTEDAFVITGTGFTPGEDVYLLFFDRSGMHLGIAHRVIASPSLFSGNSNTVPYHFYAAAGSIYHAIDHPCGITAMVQAYDPQLDQLSNIVSIQNLPGACTMSPRPDTW